MMKKQHFIKIAIFKNNHMIFMLCIIMLVIAYGLDIAFAWLMQELIDSVNNPLGLNLYTLAILFIIFFTVAILSQLVFRLTYSRFMKKAMLQYKRCAMGKLLEHNLNDYKVSNSSTILSSMSNDLATVETNYLLGMFNITTQFIFLFLAFGMMIWYNWKLTIISIIASLLAFAVSMLSGNKSTTVEKIVSEKNDISLGTIKEIIEGLPVIKVFKIEKPIGDLYEKNNQSLESAKYKRRMLLKLVNIISEYTGSFVQVGIFFLGIYFAYSGYITLGVVIAFQQLMNYILGPIQSLPEYISKWRAARELIYKLEDLLSTSVINPGKYELSGSSCDIQLKDVCFGYEKDKDVLKDINLVFESGKKYAIVGPSGSGKSTLLDLLQSGNSDYRGSILYEEKELRDISIASLYDFISVVHQNVFIFDASIKDNITLFRDFSEEEISSAVKLSGLEDFVKEKKWSYICGEHGCYISGGEKQRISIARSLLHHSCIMLMDEATSSLDEENTREILTTLLAEEKGRTRIVVTHNLNEVLLRQYDEIIVLKDGNVIEKGKFDELLNNDGYFRSFYKVMH